MTLHVLANAHSSTPAARQSGKAAIARGLIHGLLRGEWAGGDRVTEQEVVDRFGVSRTPVREALLELAGLGLVELKRNCGAVFRPLGSRELKEIYAVRALLETEAARLAAGWVNPGEMKELAAGFRRIAETGAEDAQWTLDRRLHGAIAQASGNRRLAGEIARYGELVQTVREVVGQQRLGIHRLTAEQHLAIIEALLSGDGGGSAEAMRQHLEQAAGSAAIAIQTLNQPT